MASRTPPVMYIDITVDSCGRKHFSTAKLLLLMVAWKQQTWSAKWPLYTLQLELNTHKEEYWIVSVSPVERRNGPFWNAIWGVPEKTAVVCVCTEDEPWI